MASIKLKPGPASPGLLEAMKEMNQLEKAALAKCTGTIPPMGCSPVKKVKKARKPISDTAINTGVGILGICVLFFNPHLGCGILIVSLVLGWSAKLTKIANAVTSPENKPDFHQN